jgi:hypothetical protein
MAERAGLALTFAWVAVGSSWVRASKGTCGGRCPGAGQGSASTVLAIVIVAVVVSMVAVVSEISSALGLCHA